MGPADPGGPAPHDDSTLGVALLLTAAATLYKALRGKAAPTSHRRRPGERRLPQPRHWSLPLLFGALIGTLVSITSVGAGAIGVTVLMLLLPACCRCHASWPQTSPTPCR
jgi:uncharacterized membrane protein YfcA